MPRSWDSDFKPVVEHLAIPRADGAFDIVVLGDLMATSQVTLLGGSSRRPLTTSPPVTMKA